MKPDIHAASRTPESVTVTFRRMQFGLVSLPKHWAMDSPGISHFWNVLSCGFPPVELFFIQAARPFVGKVRDLKLLRELRAFVGQESHHAHHHKVFNDQLKKSGLDVARYERWFQSALDTMWKLSDPKTRLAFTAALEHLASVFATQYLEETRTSAGVSSEIDGLWSWHSHEELEHKAVCFDLYEAVEGGYPRRVIAMGIVSPLVFALVLAGQADLIRRDVGVPTRRDLAATLRYLGGRGGVLPRAVRAIARYVRPDFHPWEEDTTSLSHDNRDRYATFARPPREARAAHAA